MAMPATRMNWINAYLNKTVRQKEKLPATQMLTPMNMIQIMIASQFEIRLYKDACAMYPNIDEEKITSLLSFIGNLSKSSQEELANFSDSSYRIVTNYYTQLFVPIYTNMNHQFLRMQLAQPKTNFDNFGKDKSENPTDQPFDQI